MAISPRRFGRVLAKPALSTARTSRSNIAGLMTRGTGCRRWPMSWFAAQVGVITSGNPGAAPAAKAGDHDHPHRVCDRQRSGRTRPGGQHQPARRQPDRRDLFRRRAGGETAGAIARAGAEPGCDRLSGQSEKPECRFEFQGDRGCRAGRRAAHRNRQCRQRRRLRGRLRNDGRAAGTGAYFQRRSLVHQCARSTGGAGGAACIRPPSTNGASSSPPAA